MTEHEWPEWVNRLVWSRVDKTDGDCWVWQGSKSWNGYAMNATGRKHTGTMYLHRAIWILQHGPIAAGYEVDHLCFNPPCINPAHLRLLTVAENRTIGRRGWGQQLLSHCPKGHLKAGDNLQVDKDGGRRCVICLKAYRKERWQQQKVASDG